MTPRATAAAVLVIGWATSLALSLPGQLSYDSVAQLHDGRSGVYNGWHPPVMAWLLGVFDSIFPGTGLFVVAIASLFFGAVLSLLWISPKPTWTATIAAVICIVLPQFLIYQGIVWKDVLFADCAIAGFACIGHAAAQWNRPAERYGLISLGIVFLVLSALSRQNGVVALVFGIAAIGTVAANRNASRRLRSFCAYGAVASLAAFLLFGASAWALATRIPGESGSEAQFKLLEDYDLIGAVKAQPGLKLDRIAQANPDLEQLMRTVGVRLYTAERNDTLASSIELQNELTDTRQNVVAAQWHDLIIDHPWLYLTIRAHVFWWTLATPVIQRCYPFFVGVQGPPGYMRDLNLAPRARLQDLALTAYGGLFVGTPVYSHLTFAVLAVLMLVAMLKRGQAPDLAMAFLLMSALTFASSFFVISIACDYRYLIFLDLSALASALYWAATRPKSA